MLNEADLHVRSPISVRIVQFADFCHFQPLVNPGAVCLFPLSILRAITNYFAQPGDPVPGGVDKALNMVITLVSIFLRLFRDITNV